MKKELICRMTKQRKHILEELKKLKTHPTADELYGLVRVPLPHISLGTVYRNLEILAEAGEIQKLETGGLQKRFDGNPENHYHVRCVTCHKINDITVDNVSFVEEKARYLCDYEIIGHRLEFIGLCPRCRKKKKNKTR
jgi:Fur family ferric uptake transcriptional regulator